MSNASTHFSQSPGQQEQKASQAQRTAEAKAAFTGSLVAAGTNIDTELQERAKNIHANEKALIKQEKGVQQETKKLAKQTDSLEKFVEKSKKQMATLDEFSPLHKDLENDLADLEEMLNMLDRHDEQDQANHGDVPR